MELRELICLLTPEEERSSLEELIGDFEIGRASCRERV